MALSITYQITSGWTYPIFPVYDYQTLLAESTQIDRISFMGKFDLFLNDEYQTTLISYPYNEVIQVNPAITKNYLEHNFNYNTTRITDNPDAVKKVDLYGQEVYSRKLSFTSITSGSGYFYSMVRLNFDSRHNLTVNDRVYLVPDYPELNPSYKNYWKVLGVNAFSVDLDAPYVYQSTARETGIAYDGVEYYDYHYNSDGDLVIQTTNPHNLNSGDTFTLQMDGWSTGTLKLVSGSTGTIRPYINGVDIAGSAISYNTDIPTTLNNLAAAISINYTTPNYTAFHETGQDTIHFYSFRTSGDSSVGYTVSADTTGDLYVVYTPAMYKSHQIDTTGQGWNPNISNQYVVNEVTTDYEFIINQRLNDYYACNVGSERGSIISSNNYIFSAVVTADTYYVFNGSNFYEYADYETEIATRFVSGSTGRFLTEQPRESIKYYGSNDIHTLDIFYQSNSGNTDTSVDAIYVRTYTGDTSNPSSAFIHLIDINDLVTDFNDDDTIRKLSIGSGAWNLNNIDSSYVTSTPAHTGDIISDDVVKYEVGFYLSAGSNDIRSEKFAFERNCIDGKYHQLVFLNKWGAWDYFHLTVNYQDVLEIERLNFEKKRNKVISSALYTSYPHDRGNTVYNINSKKTIKLYTDWLTLDEFEWLSQVFESSEVYLYIPNESNPTEITNQCFYPVNLTDSKVTQPNERSRLKRMEINAEYSNRRINQGN